MINPIDNKNKRYKICINFHNNEKLVTSYIDTITHSDIINVANKIIDYIGTLDNSIIFNYMIIQRTFNTGQIGVKFVLRYLNNDPYYLIKDIYSHICNYVRVCCYQWTIDNKSPKDDSITTYINIEQSSTNNLLTDIYDGIYWSYSIDSFSQIYRESSEEIHKLVNKEIMKSTNFIGIGGEMGYYAKANKDKFKNILLFTNSQSIYNDSLKEKQVCELVDYNIFELDNYYKDDSVLLINISKNGLKRLAIQINKLNFKQIIYISCNSVSLSKDLGIMTNYNTIVSYNIPNGRTVSILHKI